MNTTNDSARQLRDSMRQIVLAHGVLEETRRPCGALLSMPHAIALTELLGASAHLTVSDLALRLNIDRSNVSRLCTRMEAAGELLREADTGDARACRLQLTPRGRKLAASVDKSSTDHFARLVRTLGSESSSVVTALRRLHQALTTANILPSETAKGEVE